MRKDPHRYTDDNDLRALFAAMRDEDARQAPAFDPFWDEAAARADRRRRTVWMRYAAAAGLLVGLAFTAMLVLQPREAMSITEWQSPTAGLLATPMIDAEPLPTTVLLAAPSPRLDAYVPETQVFWPDDALQPDTTN